MKIKNIKSSCFKIDLLIIDLGSEASFQASTRDNIGLDNDGQGYISISTNLLKEFNFQEYYIHGCDFSKLLSDIHSQLSLLKLTYLKKRIDSILLKGGNIFRNLKICQTNCSIQILNESIVALEIFINPKTGAYFSNSLNLGIFSGDIFLFLNFFSIIFIYYFDKIF